MALRSRRINIQYKTPCVWFCNTFTSFLYIFEKKKHSCVIYFIPLNFDNLVQILVWLQRLDINQKVGGSTLGSSKQLFHFDSLISLHSDIPALSSQKNELKTVRSISLFQCFYVYDKKQESKVLGNFMNVIDSFLNSVIGQVHYNAQWLILVLEPAL